jgi:glutathione peroxidase
MRTPSSAVVISLLSVVASVAALTGGCRSAEPNGSKGPASMSTVSAASEAASIHSLTMKRLDGSDVALSSFAGKVLLIVNTASQCGFTPQYDGLQALHAKYEARGFAVLGFPSNDFGGQEPGTSQEIATFCRTKYGVAFPMFEKVKIKGADRSPLYALLSDAKGAPKWNFYKYLIDKSGRPISSWSSSVAPSDSQLAEAIEAALAAK